ncbi:MAG TPA: thiamine diphosphokinase [Spirochaetia bacterium]|nr:thiamine diphosphokinase [Spirochaetia bacterium]
MRGVLFTGGDAPHKNHVAKWVRDASIIVAADSGYDAAISFGISPDLVVGDMDSIGNRGDIERLPASKVRIFPTDKDFTDTELGIDALLNAGVDEVVIVGGGGGRLDHLLGIFALFDRPVHPSVWVSPGAEIYAVDNVWQIDGMLGSTVSFFPAGLDVCTMESRGLKWNLNGLTWRKGSAGISNIATEDRIEVTMRSGRLIMVHPIEA